VKVGIQIKKKSATLNLGLFLAKKTHKKAALKG
jgi:hypothetical protein